MDQKFVAGIGNIYSDEILFAAGLRYDRASDSLSAQEVRRLYRGMVETLSEAIKHRGSSLADEQYRDLFGEIGDYQGQHQVYDREGQACRRCRHPHRPAEGDRPFVLHVRDLPGLSDIAAGSLRVASEAAGVCCSASSAGVPSDHPLVRARDRTPGCRCSHRGCPHAPRCAGLPHSPPACTTRFDGERGSLMTTRSPVRTGPTFATSSRSPGRNVGSMLGPETTNRLGRVTIRPASPEAVTREAPALMHPRRWVR